MTPRKRVARRYRKERTAMPVLLDAPNVSSCGNEDPRLSETSLEELVVSMGKRLQADYIEGAIPYLRTHEVELWARLEGLDHEDSLDALLEYERLFFEGLHRYVNFLEAGRQAA